MAKAKEDPRDGSDDRFFAAVRGGAVTGAWYFCGEENYAKQKALEAVRGLLLPAAAEMNYTRLQEASPASVIEAAEALPFFDSRRIVVTDPPTAKEDREALLRWLPELPDSTVLLFYDRGMPGPNALFKWFQDEGRAVRFAPYDPPRATAFVCKRAAENDIRIDRFTANELVRMVGTDLSELLNALLRVGAYAGYGNEVLSSHLKKVVRPNLEYATYDVLDHLLAGRRKAAMTLVADMLRNGGSPFMIAGFLSSRLRLMYAAAVCFERGMPRASVLPLIDPRKGYASHIADDASRMGKTRIERALLDVGRIQYDQVTGRNDAEKALLDALLTDF